MEEDTLPDTLVPLLDGEELVLNWGQQGRSSIESMSSSSTPIVVVHHGAFSTGRDVMAHHPGLFHEAFKRGWSICVLNRRGHNINLKVGQWNFFGSTADVREVAEVLHKKWPNKPLLMVGLSAGSGLVGRYLGEQGLAHSSSSSSSHSPSSSSFPPHFFKAGVGICPGYDIEKCMGRFGFPYAQHLLELGKKFYFKTKNNVDLLSKLPGYKEFLEATDLQLWLDYSFGMAGFDSKEAYYDATNPMRVISSIKQPCLMINSHDDPLCLVSNALEYLDQVSANEGAIVAITRTGSHLPFLELGYVLLSFWSPRLYPSSWADRAAFEFFDAVLLQEKEREEGK